MGTGYKGTFVISWSQTDLDGVSGASVRSLSVGQTWLWRGDVVRVDGPNELLRLDVAEGEAVNRKRAARMVRRLVGAAMSNTRDLGAVDVPEPIMDTGFVPGLYYGTALFMFFAIVTALVVAKYALAMEGEPQPAE